MARNMLLKAPCSYGSYYWPLGHRPVQRCGIQDWQIRLQQIAPLPSLIINMTLSRKTSYLAVLIGLLALSAALAIAFGYISVDSWYYIYLAQGIRHGQGCSVNGSYMADYPCGYPSILALTTPVAVSGVMMVTSKLTNFAMLCADVFFVWKASRNLLMATVLVINPITLLIGMYTWSENLELFCFCGTLFALSRLNLQPRNWAFYGLLTGFLVLGCFARYFFAPFAFILFVCAWVVYGRSVALRIFPSFCVAGLVFLAYQKFNLDTTGFATGMPRIPAPEAPFLLIRQFWIAVAGAMLGIGLAGLGLLAPSYKKLIISNDRARTSAQQAANFILLAGLGFLALAFLLRFRTLFDPYNTRTIGYGVVLTLSGCVGRYLYTRDNAVIYPVTCLAISGLICVLFCDGVALPQDFSDLFRSVYQFPAASVSKFKYKGPPLNAVVFFELPSTLDTGNMDNIEEQYYGRNVTLITPISDDNKPETAPSFLHDLDGVDKSRCYFDFTPFESKDDFNAFLSTGTLIDHRFFPKPGEDPMPRKPDYDPGLKAWLLTIVQPGHMVPCAEILARSDSQRLLSAR